MWAEKPWRTEQIAFSALCSELPTRQLIRDRRRLVGKVLGIDQILRSHGIVCLFDEPLRGVVLNLRVGIQAAIVDAIQLVARAGQRRPDTTLEFAFGRGRRGLQ